MGIHDRHYVRDREPPRGGGGGPVRAMRMWSVNTWLIVICVAVFVIDGFLPLRWVPMATHFNAELTQQPDPEALVYSDPEVVLADRTGRPILGKQLVGTRDGQLVGWRRIQAMPPLQAALHFSTQRGFFDVQFWRLVGFQFLHTHDTFMHLLFNMIGLFFFGGMVEQALGSKRYLAFYLLCGIFGALMYTLLNVGGYVAMEFFGVTKPIPGLLFNDFHTPLIGASAGVFGVLMAGAYLAPNATVLMFFIIPMRLRTLAYLLVGFALFVILTRGSNAGGEAGHLGGALAGFYFIRHPHHLHGFFDFVGWIDPTSHHYRPGREARGRAVSAAARRRGAPDRAEIDRILDKVHSEGLSSLTDREKRALHDASERPRG
ncbi:MAG: rhomboid family intramembrane serine protease [Planctomycetota bacterium]|jgi:membrane associated rhomboid family serine protease